MTAVLYDAPGPKALVRNRLTGVIGTLVLAAIVGFVVYRFIATGQFEPRLWSWITYKVIQITLLQALLATLQAFALAAVLSMVFGAVSRRTVFGPALGAPDSDGDRGVLPAHAAGGPGVQAGCHLGGERLVHGVGSLDDLQLSRVVRG